MWKENLRWNFFFLLHTRFSLLAFSFFRRFFFAILSLGSECTALNEKALPNEIPLFASAKSSVCSSWFPPFAFHPLFSLWREKKGFWHYFNSNLPTIYMWRTLLARRGRVQNEDEEEEDVDMVWEMTEKIQFQKLKTCNIFWLSFQLFISVWVRCRFQCPLCLLLKWKMKNFRSLLCVATFSSWSGGRVWIKRSGVGREMKRFLYFIVDITIKKQKLN